MPRAGLAVSYGSGGGGYGIDGGYARGDPVFRMSCHCLSASFACLCCGILVTAVFLAAVHNVPTACIPH